MLKVIAGIGMLCAAWSFGTADHNCRRGSSIHWQTGELWCTGVPCDSDDDVDTCQPIIMAVEGGTVSFCTCNPWFSSATCHSAWLVVGGVGGVYCSSDNECTPAGQLCNILETGSGDDWVSCFCQ